ncbi:epsE [Symbiodinium natans]|uniref:EpsE protein n=1 Tax=Symbiodinium natans TaxID=878477 RepID=A0A812LY24_9DINO|nr:epsE [Symbiodinium natans]
MQGLQTSPSQVIDYREFVGWLTNRVAQYTVGDDGWITDFDLKDQVKPLFEIWDKDGSGHITREEFNELSQILQNSLRLHPLAKGDLLVVDFEVKEFVSLEEFVSWQSGVLQRSGVPNNKLPDLIHTLVESIQCIFDIEQMNQKATGVDKTFSALSNTIQVVAQTTRQLYAPKLSEVSAEMQVRRIMQSATSHWAAPPSLIDMQLLARTFAKAHGLRPLGFESMSASSRSPRKKSAPSRLSAVRPRTRRSVRTQIQESLGQIVLCVPAVNDGLTQVPNWFAQVDRTVFGGEGVEGGKDILLYELDRTGIIPAWRHVKDDTHFRDSMEALPKELKVLGLLKAQALMGNQLSWHAILTALTRAVSMEIFLEEDLETFSKDMLIKAAAEVKESRHFSELKDLHIVLEDAAREYLELQVVLSPLEVLTALSSLEILKVSDEVVQQLRAEMKGAPAA